ncbi:MAG TPA: hypothetical protein VLH85_07220, partial [Levilinea sp.]|nr:hypothetical protein [Levilinea sp.]
RKPEQEVEPQLPSVEPVAITEPEPAPDAAPPAVVPPRHANEAHLWHDPASGKVMAEVDGKEFTNAQHLDPEQRRKLVGMLREVATWFNSPTAKPAGAAATSTRVESSLPVHPAPAPVDLAAASLTEPRQTGSFSAQPGKKPTDVTKAAPLSIVTQIDTILQGMLVDSPLKTKGIRLVEDQAGSVTVWVGVRRYPGIDAVTDPEALAVIRAAVAEWERRSGR